jgi:hypothetical protein
MKTTSMRITQIAAVLSALSALSAPARAQVGHDPAKSPYRDIRAGTFVSLAGGYFFGNGGQVGVAPHDGPIGSLQFAFLADKTLSVLGGVHYGVQERNLINPARPKPEQVRGTVDHSTLWIDAALHFNVTGNKHWHGLAPYGGVAVGISFTEDVPEDPGSFSMGTKFTFSPLVGTRYFIGKSYLFTEARFQFWQISYPGTYAQEPIGVPPSPDGPQAVIPTGVLKEWSVTPWVRAGIGFPWSWPF